MNYIRSFTLKITLIAGLAVPAYTPGQGWQFPIWVALQSQTTVTAPSAPILPNFAYRRTIALCLDNYLHVTSSVDLRSLAIE